MSLIQMSVSGAVMILIIVVLRAVFLQKLPKRTFLILWGIVLVRLLIPYSVPASFSVYSMLDKIDTAEQISENITIPAMSQLPDFSAINTAAQAAENTSDVDNQTSVTLNTTVDFLAIGWPAGFLAFAIFFTISYIKCLRRFNESLPVENNEYIDQWLGEHRLLRKISVRQSDMISTPLTYGLLRPVILLPKKFVQDKTPDLKELKYVLYHEYLHIRRFDAVFKLLLTAALCVHWFDPMVWVMYIIANRDIEISCDEGVVRMLGENEKTDYAMALIRMEEKKVSSAPLITHFNKNSTKERIVNIMKFKKTTALAIISAAFLTLGTTAAFATSAKTDKSEEPTQQINSIDEPKGGQSVGNDDQEIIPNGLPDYVPGTVPSVAEQLKDMLLNYPDPMDRLTILYKALDMGLTVDDFADVELTDDEIAVLKGEIPKSWWREEPGCTLRAETTPEGRRVMTADGEADSGEVVNKSNSTVNAKEIYEVPYTDAFGIIWETVPVILKRVEGENGEEFDEWIGEKPDSSCWIEVYGNELRFYPFPPGATNAPAEEIPYTHEEVYDDCIIRW